MSDRRRAFLERLWELQAESGLSDPALARELGVNQTTVWRLKTVPERGYGFKFAEAACSRFPELRPLLLGEMPGSTTTMPPVTDDGASEGAA